MKTLLCATRASVEQNVSGRLFIDGHSVNDLFERIYVESRDFSERHRKPLRFDVISWADLSIAADADALTSALVRFVRLCLASEDTQGVTIRAYPCHEDVWAVFELQADLAPGDVRARQVWTPNFGSLRGAIEKMAGRWDSSWCRADYVRITFRLPQWVSPGMGSRGPLAGNS